MERERERVQGGEKEGTKLQRGRGISIKMGSEMTGKGKGKLLDFGKWEEAGMGKKGKGEGEEREERKIMGAEKEGDRETRK